MEWTQKIQEATYTKAGKTKKPDEYIDLMKRFVRLEDTMTEDEMVEWILSDKK
jgi:hypothetical protein